jgi:hypothetical protein
MNDSESRTHDALTRLTDLLVTDDGDKLFEQTFVLEGQRDCVIEKCYDGTSATPFSKVKIDWTYDAPERLSGRSSPHCRSCHHIDFVASMLANDIHSHTG